MCITEYDEVLHEDNVRDEGRIEGRLEGHAEERLTSIRALMETLHFTPKQAMDALKIPEAQREQYFKLLS